VSDPKRANVEARLVQPNGERLLQLDIYEPEGRARTGRRSYRIHLTKEAVVEMLRLVEGKD
jgi:hypothetical protein